MTIGWEKETALAVRAAAEGGRIALQRPSRLTARRKESLRDVVTPIDLAIEQHVRAILDESAYPVIGEEGGGHAASYPLADRAFAWVLDPIDGTANYVNGLDYYAVSVALCRGDRFLLGAVCMPCSAELFCTFGEGRALLNGREILHGHRDPCVSLVAASFSGSAVDAMEREREYVLFGTVNEATRGCLRLGSAAANICYTATNRIQAAYGLAAKIWDVAAAIAIAVGAGCKVVVRSAGKGNDVDYIVGSRDTVDMIGAMVEKQETDRMPWMEF